MFRLLRCEPGRADLLCSGLLPAEASCGAWPEAGGVSPALTGALCVPQDWDSSMVKAVRLKRREKRVRSVLPLQAESLVSRNWLSVPMSPLAATSDDG